MMRRPTQARIDKSLWWDKAWSLVEGCTKVSPACDNCWALSMEKRFARGDGEARGREDRLGQPSKRKKPTVYAVWNDLFHENVPLEFAMAAWVQMAANPQHTFIVLTKRPHRLTTFAERYHIHPFANVWVGTTVETQDQMGRLDHLVKFPSAVKLVSIEPMLGDFSMVSLKGLDWVICGAETGSRRRPMDKDWARRLLERCQALGIPFFFKKDSAGLGTLDGKAYHEFPE